VNQKQINGQLTSQQAADLRQQATAIQHTIGCSTFPSSPLLPTLGSSISGLVGSIVNSTTNNVPNINLNGPITIGNPMK
jgi:hypothetical protein